MVNSASLALFRLCHRRTMVTDSSPEGSNHSCSDTCLFGAATSAVQARNLEAGAEGTEGPAGLFDKPVGELLEPPPSQAEIQAWKQFLFSSGASGGFHEDAASMLARYYSRYGAGLAGQIVHLHWRKGRFVRPVSATIPQVCSTPPAAECVRGIRAPCLADTRDLVCNLERDCFPISGMDHVNGPARKVWCVCIAVGATPYWPALSSATLAT